MIKYIFFITIFKYYVFIVGIYADQALENRLARKDAVLVHYMRNHPEDFPETGVFKNLFIISTIPAKVAPRLQISSFSS